MSSITSDSGSMVGNGATAERLLPIAYSEEQEGSAPTRTTLADLKYATSPPASMRKPHARDGDITCLSVLLSQLLADVPYADALIHDRSPGILEALR